MLYQQSSEFSMKKNQQQKKKRLAPFGAVGSGLILNVIREDPVLNVTRHRYAAVGSDKTA